MNSSKVAQVQAISFPHSGKEMRSFLGLCNYFRRFIPGYSAFSAPLDALRNADTIAPTQELLNCFDTLKQLLLSAPILSYPDVTKPYYVCSDASFGGIAGALLQLPPNVDKSTVIDADLFSSSRQDVRIIGFYSRSLSKSGANYAAPKLELLAIYACFF